MALCLPGRRADVGLIFVGPLLVPDYPAALQSTGRYLAFGLITLPLAWFDRRRLRKLRRGDWLEALKLTAIGNLLYYLCTPAPFSVPAHRYRP